MKFQRWIFLGSIILFLGAIAVVAFSILTPWAWAQGPGNWFGSGSGFGMGRGRGGMMGGDDFGPGGMMGRGRGGMMGDDNFGPGFGMGPGGGPGGMMGRGRGGMMDGDDFGPGFGMGPGGGPGGMMGPGGGRRGGPDNGLLSVAATKLGLTQQELLTQLQAGKTIADLAKEKNVTVDTIVEAALAPEAGWLKGMVSSGQLTQEQADAQLTLLKANLTQRISQPWQQGGRGGMMGPANGLLSVAATKLGLTSQELLTQLQAGKTIADLAKEKNVTVDTIVEAALAPQAGWLKGMVSSGQLTQEQADAQLALLKANLTQRLSQAWQQGGRGGMMGPESSLLAVAADKLGLTSQELLTQLQAGKTIADLAKEKNVTVDTIVEAALAPHAEQLKQAVTAGQLTQEQADAQLALLKANLTQRLNQAWPQGQGWMGGHMGGGRMMGNWGW